MKEEVLDSGPGWVILVQNGLLCIMFDNCPDTLTLRRLRGFMRWNPGRRVWEVQDDPNFRRHLGVVAKYAETWQSVGETPPSIYDDCDNWFWK